MTTKTTQKTITHYSFTIPIDTTADMEAAQISVISISTEIKTIPTILKNRNQHPIKQLLTAHPSLKCKVQQQLYRRYSCNAQFTSTERETTTEIQPKNSPQKICIYLI